MSIPFTLAQDNCSTIYGALTDLQTAITGGTLSTIQTKYNVLRGTLHNGVNALVPFVGKDGGGNTPDANELTGGDNCDV